MSLEIGFTEKELTRIDACTKCCVRRQYVGAAEQRQREQCRLCFRGTPGMA